MARRRDVDLFKDTALGDFEAPNSRRRRKWDAARDGEQRTMDAASLARLTSTDNDGDGGPSNVV